jgi:hypothetical protein
MDKKNVPSIESMVQYPIDYPDGYELLDGIGDGAQFNYVTPHYLRAIIARVTIIDSYMVRRHTNDNNWECACICIDHQDDTIEGLQLSFAFCYDDILILAKSGSSYLIFWRGRMIRDRHITRLAKDNFTNDDECKTAFYNYCKDEILDGDNELKQIPTEFWSGKIEYL